MNTLTIPRHEQVELEEFMHELWWSTLTNPLARYERVWNLRAAFEIKPFDGRIRLACVRSFERHKGNGSAALDWLCALADKHGVTIVGDIDPVRTSEPGLNVAQLKAWYKRHGFTVRGREIVRVPRKDSSE